MRTKLDTLVLVLGTLAALAAATAGMWMLGLI